MFLMFIADPENLSRGDPRDIQVSRGNEGIFLDILLCKLEKIEFSNGRDSPNLDPCDPPLDSRMCRLIKMTAYPLLHEPIEKGGGGGINVEMRLCFNTCVAFKNHTLNMKCSICLI